MRELAHAGGLLGYVASAERDPFSVPSRLSDAASAVGADAETKLIVPGHPELAIDMPIPYGGMNRHIWAAHDRMFDWLSGYGLLPGNNLSVLKGSRCDLLTGCYYPNADLPTLELLDQFMGWGFIIDDQVDDCTVGLDPDRTAAVIAEFVSILNDSPPSTMTPAGRALADWWRRVTGFCTDSWRSQFVNSAGLWLWTYAREARYWADGHVPSLEEYLSYRRDSIASWTYSDLCELANRDELSEQVRRLPSYQEMRIPMAMHVALTNDILSYEKQRELGRQDDAITILVKEKGCSEEEGLAMVVAMVNRYLRAFLDSEQRFYLQLKDAGIDPAMQESARRAVQSLRTHIRASADWEIDAIERFGGDTYYVRGSDSSVEDVLVLPATS
ncbi:terpene synthase family protein [Kitasatospora sp. NPDC048239]|uniref:terpene synthase family protein n=1 Tax=Kitasatospora sp. NPDC048239 TaxID=3364046 RepID=UPI003716F300